MESLILNQLPMHNIEVFWNLGDWRCRAIATVPISSPMSTLTRSIPVRLPDGSLVDGSISFLPTSA